MLLEEAIKLEEYMKSLKFVKKIHLASDGEISSDFAAETLICLEIRHDFRFDKEDQREIFYIDLLNYETNRVELYSKIISYMREEYFDYTNLRINHIIVENAGYAISNILNATVKDNLTFAVPVNISFTFNGFYHKNILVLMDVDGDFNKNATVTEIEKYIKENNQDDLKIETKFNVLPYTKG
jgi:hypothetical protein